MLVAGSYERFLFGLECGATREAPTLSRAFTFPAHKGAIKCVAALAPFVASGGADDTIHLYNFQTNTDVGFLMSPGDGAVSAVRFFAPAPGAAPSHLLSGSADGSISIWAANAEWDCLKTLPGHKKEVCGLAVHPSGRLALSTGRDSVLRMWNLVKGRCQYKTSLPACSECVEFSPGGGAYALACGRKVSVQSVEGGVLATREQAARALCLAFLSEQVLVLGGEDGSLNAWDVRSSSPALALPRAHAARIRGVAPAAAPGGGGASALGAASSDGVVRLWDLRRAGSAGASGSGAGAAAATRGWLAEVATGARKKKAKVPWTAVAHAEGAAPRQQKKRDLPDDGVVVHDGVVEFLDGPGKGIKVKGKKRKALDKP
ncbi:hypothetical protein WJX81_002961 [Elliptochloris bilobata]|uniref:Uncharacterized protein n=1 Tax=Elliptochloris bilobata TaxID=381761 RepID=A0AAW1RN99_9CHLO